jgi:hypothetical protein
LDYFLPIATCFHCLLGGSQMESFLRWFKLSDFCNQCNDGNCEICKAKELMKMIRFRGFSVVSVSLDSRSSDCVHFGAERRCDEDKKKH